MSQTLASPPPLASPRGFWARVWDDPNLRSIAVGVLGMLLVHLLLLLFAPYALRIDRGPHVTRPRSYARQFNIQLAPETFPKPVPKQQKPFKFVETNPDAPENIPDKTENFGAQNQQAAQEKPAVNQHHDRPQIEGQKEIHSTQIVSGQLQKPTEQLEQAHPEITPQETAATAPRQEQNPLSGFDKTTGKDDQGYASALAKPADTQKPVPYKIEGVKNAPNIEGATSTLPQIDPKHPRPRPMVVRQQQVRPAIFEENKFGTQNIGPVAYDARWSNYGAYLQRMIESIQIEWDRILIESRAYPISGTHVTVKFRLDKEGKISAIIDVEGTAGNEWEKVCTSAITNRAPYGPWTDDMITVLGDSQELTFTFYYQ